MGSARSSGAVLHLDRAAFFYEVEPMKIVDQVKMIFDEYPGGALTMVVFSAFAGAVFAGVLLSP